MARSPSTFSPSTSFIAASVTSTGVCMAEPGNTSTPKAPSSSSARRATFSCERVQITSIRRQPSASASARTSAIAPGPNTTREGRLW